MDKKELYTATNIKDVWIIRPNGELDMSNSAELKEQIKREFIHQGKVDLIIDLSHVDYMDSSALGVLIGLQKSCRLNGGALILCGLEENLKRIFKMTSLDSVFSIRATVEDALKVFLEGDQN
ncbi:MULTISPECIES: STAS domain-containing protein [Pseudothermotoga]|jgi:anti-sigma B factor antagonist|uniref:Anti-sigma factor antagonist n=1 Tax=Pseudothermotoga lettingae (strain ATCC BAA-301 / DSM 14385 / NBRC 107922 / TMO) TaxID=416591 RepID=A8F428_PSELT|nr:MULTISPECIES: STAS domain-containing protein [Pseudothermotoga]ABV32912.1 anti-sigma-factor antagonist [Pseudothermotoga lettingae TMO]KUK21799.1 MAG: Stage II sporulation protein [Pseudothermotoga lettingae]MDI3494022.1 anti-sigma factor antagonist [Pseudothermotoga sp.]MDK2884962.1 anti-sigma factor antagonist [Pseudothermotoga sp.]GLI48089.1 putative anti-sigma factor antagonist [Pseudothermotoga lettingae TMO]